MSTGGHSKDKLIESAPHKVYDMSITEVGERKRKARTRGGEYGCKSTSSKTIGRK
jgi:hypothetical protein